MTTMVSANAPKPMRETASESSVIATTSVARIGAAVVRDAIAGLDQPGSAKWQEQSQRTNWYDWPTR